MASLDRLKDIVYSYHRIMVIGMYTKKYPGNDANYPSVRDNDLEYNGFSEWSCV